MTEESDSQHSQPVAESVWTTQQQHQDAVAIKPGMPARVMHWGGEQSLSPGQATEGFVYYQMPQKNASFQGTLQVSLVNTRNQQNNTLQIPIDYEIK